MNAAVMRDTIRQILDVLNVRTVYVKNAMTISAQNARRTLMEIPADVNATSDTTLKITNVFPAMILFAVVVIATNALSAKIRPYSTLEAVPVSMATTEAKVSAFSAQTYVPPALIMAV
jgi:hypothetical protein